MQVLVSLDKNMIPNLEILDGQINEEQIAMMSFLLSRGHLANLFVEEWSRFLKTEEINKVKMILSTFEESDLERAKIPVINPAVIIDE